MVSVWEKHKKYFVKQKRKEKKVVIIYQNLKFKHYVYLPILLIVEFVMNVYDVVIVVLAKRLLLPRIYANIISVLHV